MMSNMLVVSIIIIAFFGSLIFISSEYEEQQSEKLLKMVLENTSANVTNIDVDSETLEANMDADTMSRLTTVVAIVQTDNHGNVLSYISDSATDLKPEFLDTVVKVILRDKDETDTKTVTDFMFRYLRMPNGVGGYKIAIADTSLEDATLRFMMRIYFFTGLFFMGVMFLISDHMASKAIAPLEKSWNNQNQFVADASHELKTPLTVILANMDIMNLNPNATVAEQKKWIDNTKSEASRMTELVNDMLFLAKGDAGVEQNFKFEEINSSNLVRECVLTFESIAFEKGISFNEDIDDDIYVVADEAKIKQAIIILIDNALKYVNEKGSINISLKLTGKNTVKCLVQNSGPAIPKEKQDHVFERFFRVDESRSRDRGGYGLGLAIASNIMEAHRGKIALEFSDERGTCFSLSLPPSRPVPSTNVKNQKRQRQKTLHNN